MFLGWSIIGAEQIGWLVGWFILRPVDTTTSMKDLGSQRKINVCVFRGSQRLIFPILTMPIQCCCYIVINFLKFLLSIMVTNHQVIGNVNKQIRCRRNNNQRISSSLAFIFNTRVSLLHPFWVCLPFSCNKVFWLNFNPISELKLIYSAQWHDSEEHAADCQLCLPF